MSHWSAREIADAVKACGIVEQISGRHAARLLNRGTSNRLARRFLNLLRQLRNLGAVLLVGWHDKQGEQMTKSVDSNMNLAPFSALGAIVGCTLATFRGRWQSATIEDRGSRMGRPLSDFPQQHAQIVDNCLEHTRCQPAVSLLVHRISGWQVVGHHSPLRPSSSNVASPVEHVTQ